MEATEEVDSESLASNPSQVLAKEGAHSLETDEKIEELEEELKVGEERITLQARALRDPSVQQLIQSLVEWLNETLEDRRIIIKNLIEDLYDGQVLGELIEVLEGTKIDIVALASPILQKGRLRLVLKIISDKTGIAEDQAKWNVEAIHSKDAVAILHILVALARHYRIRQTIPKNVKVRRIRLKQHLDRLETVLFEETITGEEEYLVPGDETSDRDVFDRLFEAAPEKLNTVKTSLLVFVNKHLSEMEVQLTRIEGSFQDGINLIYLMGILENYYIPFYIYYPSPDTEEQKVHNVLRAFQLMEDADISTKRVKPEDVVKGDLKSILRVLYLLFSKYKTVRTTEGHREIRGKTTTV